MAESTSNCTGAIDLHSTRIILSSEKNPNYKEKKYNTQA